MVSRSREIKRRLGIRAGRQLFLPRVNIRRMREFFYRVCVVAVLLAVLVSGWRLLQPGMRVRVHADTVAAFRVPHRAIGLLEVYAARYGIPFAELFAIFVAENDFFPEKSAVHDISGLEELYVQDFNRIMRRYNSRSIAPYVAMFRNLFGEIETFPVPSGWYLYEPSVMFGNSWGVAHNFQGNRMHMGTAIVDRENIRGRVPIVSMTRGLVQDASWCNQLGYFVGVVTPSGSYYLYAHLHSLAPGLAPGQNISAGHHLGQMGNTGGGRGAQTFPVHLHLAISPDVSFTRGQFWINPYPFLRYLDDIVR